MDIVSYLLGKQAGGSPAPTPTYQSKDVSITQNGTTTIKPDPGYDALSDVDVTVTGILDTSDATAVASDMATGVTAYVNGAKITGNVPVGSSSVATDYNSDNVSISSNNLKVDTAQGVTNQMFRTGDKISVYAPLSDVAPVVGATAEKIKKDEVICGVTGTYEGGGSSYAPSFIKFQGYTGEDLTYETANLDASNLTSMYQMFSGCNSLTTLNISSWNTPSLTNMNNAFYYCRSLPSVNLSSFDTSQVTNANGCFDQDTALTSITFGSNCTFENNPIFATMFRSCSHLTTLDVSMFNMKKATNVLQMFSTCTALTHIDFGNNWELPLLQANYQNMFNGCLNLDNSTLNAILHICTTMTNVGTKTLAYIGLTSTQATTCQGLSNYQEFLSAGWTTGY